MKKYERFEDEQNGIEVVATLPIDAAEVQLPPKMGQGYSRARRDINGTVTSATSQEQVDALENATYFFYDHEERLNFLSDGEDLEDPSQPPTPGFSNKYISWRLRRLIQHLFFRLLTLIVILSDICLLIADLATASPMRPLGSTLTFETLNIIFSSFFLFEITLRILALQKQFLYHWYNIVDLVIIVVTFILAVVESVIRTDHGYLTTARVIVLLRLLRVIRLSRLITEKKHVEAGARLMVSQNKRRYQQDGFDLDLTYVTDKVIAMSFPSSGRMSFYRNPIREVAKFLDTKHKNHYKVYNTCSERSYDETFFHNRVERFLIDDHNVPTLKDMVGFVEDAEQWMIAHPVNVIAVHCKGGKGRTGTLVCVWLIRKGLLANSKACLDYFGRRRTDSNVGHKFQGVETPSQCRFVEYFEKVHANGLQLPKPVTLSLCGININGLMGVGRGDGSDFSVEIDQGRRNTVFTATFGTQQNCETVYNTERDCLEVKLLNCPPLTGEIRVLFRCTSRKVPIGYERVPFYCWFHTAFIEGYRLVLKREDLDNPHKPKTWKVFREAFQVEFLFS
ncbi:unnamed protein product [Darwinula stevensoni]|uniref:Phosphatidylinositol-3,4,5-trisphosphate 3-phosphatase n=1 Tax=Darwinula stevensoni TaxID=69355 RepID=A0A7R8X385_9CRUS|nr:unnamed protein product [Darwinula stevensoni]CAG0884104.1 unnamed protein product [Darwinula stevensoni]